MVESFTLPGDFRQIGYIVRDLDQSIAAWLALGVGPFYVIRGLQQHADYRGEPCTVNFSVAFSNNGELQIELIQQEDDTPSIYTEFLESGREGMHQLAWWAPDFDATIAAARAAGWPVVWSGGADGGARYAYIEPPDAGPATIVEIMELNDMTTGMATLVRDAAASWDGSDPIRSLGI
jgi:catechol 2,3-dioxygenase-like lactoylglutathione lyase family enzyme